MFMVLESEITLILYIKTTFEQFKNVDYNIYFLEFNTFKELQPLTRLLGQMSTRKVCQNHNP